MNISIIFYSNLILWNYLKDNGGIEPQNTNLQLASRPSTNIILCLIRQKEISLLNLLSLLFSCHST